MSVVALEGECVGQEQRTLYVLFNLTHLVSRLQY